MDGNLAMANSLENKFEPKNIEYALNIAECELKSMYKKLGYTNSSALIAINNALKEIKGLRHHEEIKDLFIETVMRTNLAFPATEQEDIFFSEGVKKQFDFQTRLWNMLIKLRQ